MSIIYSLIARSTDIVLCEYTEFAGNFQQVTRVLLRKATKKNTRFIFPYDKYKFHYLNENEITYLCMSDNFEDAYAFSFLSDVRKKFLQQYDIDRLSSSTAYSLTEFNDHLKNLAVLYIIILRNFTIIIRNIRKVES